ncbi:hypothetical protein P691DRAFT_804815 [Macrolepiota fuliginosa MF-IS2]|uniref:Uncharacterized protein n=1 Tax=Macrolepiota fuliginosa MF-IS2 TaxID=1400762 RepID=A0A9P6C1Y4_9AGAR|nr:hypothetical protein P691DRAFT_804815 [Macrolepiota fuliginosa MF-IS2]
MENDDGSPSNKDVIKFCASQGWDACRKLSDEFIPALVSRLEHFNFCCLKYEHIKQFGVTGEGFGMFLSWLHSLVG